MTVAVIIIAVVILLASAAISMAQRRRTSQLRARYGGEYDRALAEHGSRRAAESDLVARQQRHTQLRIRQLPRQRATDYAARWQAAQTTFADEPLAAVADADELVLAVMTERGYPVGDFDDQVQDLSVAHADVVQHYRAAHAIAIASRQEADTEQLRRAMVHYRAVFSALLDETDTDEAQRQEADDDELRHSDAAAEPDGPGHRDDAGHRDGSGHRDDAGQQDGAGRRAGPGPADDRARGSDWGRTG